MAKSVALDQIPVSIRPFDRSDIPGLTTLVRSTLTLDPFVEVIPGILTRLEHVGYVAEINRKIVGCCIGSMTRYGDDGDAHLDLISVEAIHRRAGIGSALLAVLEKELVRRGARRLRIEGNAPSYAWAGIDVHYTSGICFVESADFVRGRCVVNMDVALTKDNLFDTELEEAELGKQGITVRSGNPDDRTTIAQLKPHWRPRWINQIEMALESPSGEVYFAMRGEECVGFGAFGANRPHELGPLGVESEVRKQGLGSVLIRSCCRSQRSMGLQASELQWAGPLGYFSDILEAKIGRVFWLYHKDIGHNGVVRA